MSTALVTGATAGLGAEFARQLAASGNDVVLVARDHARLESVKVALEERHGVKADVLSADLSTVDGCDAVAARIASIDVPIDILINNAGMGMYKRFGRAELVDEERQLDLNVRAVLRLTHAAVRVMSERGSGQIINVSSVAGFVPRGGNATYSASKAWVTMFSEALSVQLAGVGVQVTAICPGFTHTEFHERAQADMSRVPDWMWLDAEAVVSQGLADARRGKPLSVPSAKYKVLTGAARHVPRPVLHRIMRRGAL
jgi:short-subunit dehydrogenase